MTLIEKIISYMEIQGYKIFRNPGEKNIVYLEGVDTNGFNSDKPNHFNDLRLVFGFEGKKPAIEGKWTATTEPGYYYTDNPMNPNGAARIAFGQYEAWQVGIHGYSQAHEALVQVHPVRVHRDYNRDMIRTGDAIESGLFGINQHHGYDHPSDDIYTASAGCLVGRTRSGHQQFMLRVKSDPRYIAERNFIFTAVILDGSKL
ncbi:hypothetical protein QUB63_22560 [Microcoleus sp. ARI1-B5]|uniref:hypothetical protein n=1 Tax=unclassified Microcoleus TaxID=2642155 RepID=UPI002FD01FCA